MRLGVPLLFASLNILAYGAEVGSLSGSVVDDDGKSIAGALVSIAPTMVGKVQGSSLRPAQRERSTSRAAVSDTNGFFVLESIPVGSYRICAVHPSGQWLSTCDWGSGPIRAAVGATPDTSKRFLVPMKRAAVINIAVEDPGRFLESERGKSPGAHILIGVGGESLLFRPSVPVSSVPGRRVFRSYAPFGFPVKVVVSSAAFKLSDAGGRPFQGTTATSAVTVSPAQGTVLITFLVAGANTQ